MSTRSNSKDKKAAKEPPKVSSKPSIHVNTSAGTPASGYNPVSGTFHAFDTSSISSTSPLHVNGRFQNINDTDDQNGNGIEYDIASNNDSWSGESEEHKDKTSQNTPRQESVPGADNEKREKIRQKNEKKHQRQKERRAQELHEKCSGYLMSRKLEALAQQLVAMGFSQERATMALILNEGKVEESVSWLFESSEEDSKQRERNLDHRGNLKIDISDELNRIADLAIRHKISKQDVERAVVAVEGDLDKALDTLKEHKPEPIKPVETGDPPILANGKLPVAPNPNVANVNYSNSNPPSIIQQKRDDRDFNYTKPPVTVMGSFIDPGTKNMQVLKKIPPKPEWTQPQHITVPTDKRWTSMGSNNPSVSYSLQASPTPSMTEARFIGNELKNLQLGSVREPVIVMQRPQTINSKQVPSSSISSSPPGMTTSWYPNSTSEMVKANGLVPPVTVSRSFGSNGVSSNPLYNQFHYQSQQFVPSSSSGMESQNQLHYQSQQFVPSSSSSGMESQNQLHYRSQQFVPSSSSGMESQNQLQYRSQQFVPSSSSGMESQNQLQYRSQQFVPSSSSGIESQNQLQYRSQQFVPSSSSGMESQGGNGLWSRGGASHTIAPASNLGLFSGTGTNRSSGSSSPVDWITGSSTLTDYSSIDWSLDRGSLLTSRATGGLTSGSYPMQNNARTFDSFAYGLGVNSATRPIPSGRNGGPRLGLQDEVAAMEAAGGGSREWSSPFEEKDIFGLSRQFVTSPSI